MATRGLWDLNQMMSTMYISELADDFNKLYETKEDYDAIIIVGKEPSIKEFQVHSLILRTRSSYFHSAFSYNWAERNNNGFLIFKKPNISALVFEIILKYLYCGIMDFQSQKSEIILELLIAADELGIQRLINSVQEFLIQNCYNFLQSDPIKMLDLVTCHNAFDNLKNIYLEIFNRNYKDFLRQNPIKILHFIIHNDAFNELRKFSLETICENLELLFNSEEFFSLEKEILVLILNRDDLDVKEIDIWKLIIKWGIAQHSTFQSNVAKFTSNDFNKLEKTISELIKLVRFHQIKSEEFMRDVWPLRQLLPENLIEDMLRCYLVPGAISHYHTFPIREGNINIKVDSTIINKRIALLFTKWINKKIMNNESTKEIRYNFNLLFRSSVDGFSSQVFHYKCDNKGATIVVAKISNSNMLVGGYNPLDWNGNGYISTTDSFIFSISLNDLNDPINTRFGHATNSNYAVYCHNYCGPTFGGGATFGGNSTFGGGRVFGDGTTFGGGRIFGDGTTFGGGRIFGDGATFGGGPNFGGGPTFGGGKTFKGGPTFGGGTAFRGGPTFGSGANFGGFGFQTPGGIGSNQTLEVSHDLYVPSNGNIWKFNVHSYPNIVIPNPFATSDSFEILDYEVFQVVKN